MRRCAILLADTRLARTVAAQATSHPNQSGAYPLSHGIEALAARMILARLAEKTLDVQYYIWHGDESGRLLLKELLNAADRGVRVVTNSLASSDVGSMNFGPRSVQINTEIGLLIDSTGPTNSVIWAALPSAVPTLRARRRPPRRR